MIQLSSELPAVKHDWVTVKVQRKICFSPWCSFCFCCVCFRLVFPAPVRELPYESMLTFHLLGSKQSKSPELLCWAALPLFNNKYAIKRSFIKHWFLLVVFYLSAVSQMLYTHMCMNANAHSCWLKQFSSACHGNNRWNCLVTRRILDLDFVNYNKDERCSIIKQFQVKHIVFKNITQQYYKQYTYQSINKKKKLSAIICSTRTFVRFFFASQNDWICCCS